MMRAADRAQALEIAAELARAGNWYGDLTGVLYREGAATINALLAHIDALTPMARAWANGESTYTAGTATVTVMDPAEDC